MKKIKYPNNPVEESKPKISRSRKLLFIVYAISAPILCFSFTLACSGQVCKLTTIPDLKPYLKIDSWFTLRSLWLTLSYVITIFLYSFFPYFGKEAVLPGSKRPFVANGLSLFILILIVTLSMEKYISISDVIHEDFVQLCLLWIFTAFVFGIYLFFKGKDSTGDNNNPRAYSENRLYDFFVGREISPFSGNIHYKVCFFRIGIIGMTYFNFIWLYLSLKIGDVPVPSIESLMSSVTYLDIIQTIAMNTTLVVFSFMEMFYGLCFLYFEESSVYMFEFMYEGVGFYFIFTYFVYPFTTPMITKLILDHNIHLTNSKLTFILIVYLFGCYVNFSSNNEKNLFRKNPLHPSVASLKTLPTSNGNHLIVSSWWGFVRHPNYLGDFIAQSMLMFIAYDNVTIYIVIAQLVYLVHRVERDRKRCSERYGADWELYCQKVPYALIPKIW